jgi:hypothetical protein
VISATIPAKSNGEDSVIKTSKINQLLDLLESTTSLSEVSILLKACGVPFSSGSWKQMREERIQPALKSGKLTVAALVRLLRESEEYGGQHIFLYQSSKSNASEVVTEVHLAKCLKSLGRTDLLEEPDVLSVPGSRALADARLEDGPNGRVLVLKAVESRTYYRFENAQDENGGRYRIKRYRRIEVRAVDVLRVHRDGFTELRIHAHETGNDYSNEVTAAWHFFAPFVSRFQFSDLSISKAQQMLWKNRASLKRVLRYSDSRLRDSQGATLSAATGAQQGSLFENEHAARSIDAFWDDDTVCDKSNMWWLKSPEEFGGVPSRSIHVVITGTTNEFGIPAQCSKEDYEYVLAQIKKSNR